MTDLTEWSSNANEVLHIRLRHPSGSKSSDVQFQPAFTYPLFGEDELIFGYKGLKARLDFAADTLKPSLSVTWIERFTPIDDAKPDEVEEILSNCLPRTSEDASALSSSDSNTFEPPGELLHQYEVEGRAFGIWMTNLGNPAAKRILANMQILVLFFIEGGSMLELEDPDWTMERWTIFLIYAIDPVPSNTQSSTYSLVGYSTVYSLWFLDPTSPLYPESTLSQSEPPFLAAPLDPEFRARLPCRQRISQFLILPPYQHSGHGSILYSTITQHFLAAPNVHEITVEDPNESFDEMRDVNDLIRLRTTVPAFASLSINSDSKLPTDRSSSIDPNILLTHTDLTTLRQSQKIPTRQFARLVEMQLLSHIPTKSRNTSRITRKERCSDPQDRAYYFWRFFTKFRLYRQNVDQLAQVEPEERVDMLEATLGGVENEYTRILELVEKRVRSGARNGFGNGKVKTAEIDTRETAEVLAKKRKRRVVGNDEDDDEEGEAENKNTEVNGKHEESGQRSVTSSTKKQKQNDAQTKKKKLQLAAEMVDLSSDD